MTISIIAGLVAASTVYAFFLYKKRQLVSLKESYYSEIKAVFDVTKKANKLASEELASVVLWVNTELPAIIALKVSTNPNIADLIDRYNLDEKTYLTIFSGVSDDITEKITERFGLSTSRIQTIYAEELSTLVKEERNDVPKA